MSFQKVEKRGGELCILGIVQGEKKEKKKVQKKSSKKVQKKLKSRIILWSEKVDHNNLELITTNLFTVFISKNYKIEIIKKF